MGWEYGDIIRIHHHCGDVRWWGWDVACVYVEKSTPSWGTHGVFLSVELVLLYVVLLCALFYEVYNVFFRVLKMLVFSVFCISFCKCTVSNALDECR